MKADSAPPGVGVMRALLPSTQGTLLIRAATSGNGDVADQAWKAWRDAYASLDDAFRGHAHEQRSLAPQIAHQAEAGRIDATKTDRTFLRVAAARETLRHQTHQQRCAEVLDALNDARLPFLVVGSAAHDALHYPAPALRHVEGLQLFVRPRDAPEATTVLGRLEYEPVPASGRRPRGIQTHRRRTGMEVQVRTWPVRAPDPRGDIERVIGEAVQGRVAGRMAPVAASADLLLYALSEAAWTPGRATLAWATDAVHTLRASNVDWNRFLGAVVEARAATATFAQIDFLAREAQARVPADVLTDLRRAAADAPRHDLHASFLGAYAGAGRLGALLHRGLSGSDRRRVLGWLLAPDADYVERVEGGAPGPIGRFAARPLRFLALRIRGRARPGQAVAAQRATEEGA